MYHQIMGFPWTRVLLPHFPVLFSRCLSGYRHTATGESVYVYPLYEISHPGCLMLRCGCTGYITRSITRPKATTCDYMHTQVPRLLCETLLYVSKQDALLSSAMPCHARSVLHFDRCHSSLQHAYAYVCVSISSITVSVSASLSMYLHVTQAPRRM